MKTETLRRIFDIDPRMIQCLNDLQYSFLGSGLRNIIRLVYALKDTPTKKISSFNKADADFVITNQKRIREVICTVFNFILDAKLHAYYDNPKESIRPLISIAYHLFHKQVEISEFEYYWKNNPKEFVLFETWLYHSLLFGKFRNIKDVPSPIEDLLEIFEEHKLQNYSVFTVDDLDKFDKEFVLFLLSDRRSTLKEHIEVIGHLMSPFFLKQYNYSDEAINNIRNLGIFDSRHLRIKECLRFSEWMNFCIANRKIYSEKAVIPENEELWTEENFPEFCEARGKLIIDIINLTFTELGTETPSN